VYILIIGCGHLGSTLSQDLSNQGHDICVLIDLPRSSAILAPVSTGRSMSLIPTAINVAPVSAAITMAVVCICFLHFREISAVPYPTCVCASVKG